MLKPVRILFSHHAYAAISSLGEMLRSPVASTLTVTMMAIALALPLSFYVVVQNVQTWSAHWHEGYQITLYLKTDTEMPRITSLVDELSGHTLVSNVHSISAQEAKSVLSKDAQLREALNLLDHNPLPHVLVVSLETNQSSLASLQAFARELGNRPEVASAELDAEWIERFEAFLALINQCAHFLVLCLGLGVILILGNTIRLLIEQKRPEINVIKLVGGSQGFIRRPFLYTGIWYGLVAGCLACAIVFCAILWLEAPLYQWASYYGFQLQLQGFNLVESLAVLGGAVGCGWLGAWLAVSRQMKHLQSRVC